MVIVVIHPLAEVMPSVVEEAMAKVMTGGMAGVAVLIATKVDELGDGRKNVKDNSNPRP